MVNIERKYEGQIDGTNRFLRKSAVFCQNLRLPRKSAKISENLRKKLRIWFRLSHLACPTQWLEEVKTSTCANNLVISEFSGRAPAASGRILVRRFAPFGRTSPCQLEFFFGGSHLVFLAVGACIRASCSSNPCGF